MSSEVRPIYLPPIYQEGVDHGSIIMRDGTPAVVRMLTPDDQERAQAFFSSLSKESLYDRFMSVSQPDISVAQHLCNSSEHEGQGVLGICWGDHDNERVLAIAQYNRVDEQVAEFAVVVADNYQGKGVGAILLERLAVKAAMEGFTKFIAVTKAMNHRMLEIFYNSGFEQTKDVDDGYVTIDFSVTPSLASLEQSELKERVFTAASIRPFFKPEAVAVIGASSKPGRIGYRILEALKSAGYKGVVYPVNPSAQTIMDIPCFSSMRDIPGSVDLAVLAVPPIAMLSAVDDCAAKGVKALVVISAGFSETGEAGQKLQKQIVDKARSNGMRLIGPNCLGVINTDPDVRLNASFSPIFPPGGRVSMYSQSGALGLAVLSLATARELGLSSFVSVGNKADVSGNDLLQYWEEDSGTDVILIYLEAFKNPRRFQRIARRVGTSKPIICIKAGKTSAGQRAASSHTAALAGSDVPVEALFKQSGIIRADALDEMFDVAAILAYQPLPQGSRVGIVTNAGGPGILCADVLETGKLSVPGLSAETQEKLAAFLPSAGAFSNPVDMIASATPEHYKKTIETVLMSGEIDALIVIYIPVGVERDQDILDAAAAGIETARGSGVTRIPVMVCPMIHDKKILPINIGEERIPTFAFPEAASRALCLASDYAAWRRKVSGVYYWYDNIKSQDARAICQQSIQQHGDGWLSIEDTRAVLSNFGLPVAPGGVSQTEEDTVEIAEKIGYPVAVKLASRTLVHKTEINGVHLNLKNKQDVKTAYRAIRKALSDTNQDDAFHGALVQPMCKEGVEVMVGMTEDPTFGPLIAFGLGGIHVEILADVSFRVSPLTNVDAKEMISEIRGYRLLNGYRGHPPADIPAIEELLLRTSLLVEEIPEITELDMNPVFALKPGEGCCIADMRIRVAALADSNSNRYTLQPSRFAAV